MAEPTMKHGSAMAELVQDDASRRRFLKMVGAGGASAFAVFLAACGDDDEDSASTSTTESSTPETTPSTSGEAGGEGDLAIVNYALTLEYLEAQFYADVIDSGLVKGKAGELAKTFGENEQEHVDALIAAVEAAGGTPAEKPTAEFPLEDEKSILELAATVENLGAAAYLGQAGAIMDKEILAAALAIHSVEARHAAALNSAIGKEITPDGAFAKPATMEEVLEAVKPFIKA